MFEGNDSVRGGYSEGQKIAAVLYLHRISDIRFSGIARRNFNTFRKLCGERTLKNVCIVTTMWEQEDSGALRRQQEEKEKEIAQGAQFFKPALDEGAKMMRHDGTRACAERILRSIISRDEEPGKLRVQVELIDEEKQLDQTQVGSDLKQRLQEKLKEQAKELKLTVH